MKKISYFFSPWNIAVQNNIHPSIGVENLLMVFKENYESGNGRVSTQIEEIEAKFKSEIKGLEDSMKETKSSSISEEDKIKIQELLKNEQRKYQRYLFETLAYQLEHHALNIYVSPFTDGITQILQSLLPFEKPISLWSFLGTNQEEGIRSVEDQTLNHDSFKKLISFTHKNIPSIHKKHFSKSFEQLSHATYKGLPPEKFMHQNINDLTEFVILQLDLSILDFSWNDYPNGQQSPTYFLELLKQFVNTRRKIIGVHIIHDEPSAKPNNLYVFLEELKMIVGKSVGIFKP